jgi:plasmid replication initiation protein
MALKYVDVDMSNLAPTDNTGEQERNRIQAMGQENKRQIDQQKLNLSRQQLQADLYNKAADRSLKLRDIESKEKIAKMNKNKYDK